MRTMELRNLEGAHQIAARDRTDEVPEHVEHARVGGMYVQRRCGCVEGNLRIRRSRNVNINSATMTHLQYALALEPHVQILSGAALAVVHARVEERV